MLTAMKYLNSYLVTNIPYPITIGGDIDYQTNDRVVRITWTDDASLTGVSTSQYDAGLRIECYTKKSNVYDHMDMADTIRDLFSHNVVLDNGDVLEQVGEIRVNYLDLDGARKANMIINLRKEV